MESPRQEAAEARPEPEAGGTCENCGGPLNEHGLSPYLAEAEQLEPTERRDETDQHAAGAAMHESAFADAIRKRGA